MSSPHKELVSEYQKTLLVAAERFFGRDRIPERIRQAFMDTPRHLFAPRFYSSTKRDWVEQKEADLRDHLAELYSDHPLCIYRDENGKSLSTVSQPSLVLYMLDLLELEQGQRVFELGGGSGWNAAMMGRLVGPNGQVVSLEIIDGLVPSARETLDRLALNQVHFSSGDANLGCKGKTFDRGIFTASAWDLPRCFFEQIKEGGLLLFVLKTQPNYDLLCLLRKASDTQFDSELHFSCSFVPVTGSNRHPTLQPIAAAKLTLPKSESEISWDDIKISNTLISDFIDFLKLVFDCQQTYLLDSHDLDFDEEFWAVGTPEEGSLILFNEDRLIQYGTDSSLIALRRAAKRWQKAKQPGIEDMNLSVFRTGHAPEPTNDQWLVSRGDATFRWGVSS